MRQTAMGVLAALLLMAGCSGCQMTPYKRIAIAYQSISYSARLAEAVDDSFDKWLKEVHAHCKSKHAVKTAEFDACVLPALKVVRAWTGKVAGQDTGKGILPMLQVAQREARRQTDNAYDYVKANEKKCGGDDAPKNCSVSVEQLLGPATCSVKRLVDKSLEVAKAYGSKSVAELLENKWYKLAMAAIEGFACKGG